jgi:pyruvate dehydrogenase E1 component
VATAGRTTLAGEGLQHQDGHSLVLASTVPVCQAYDPAFAYEVGTIVQRGIKRMYGDDPDDVFYYLTVYNENYAQPARPGDVEQGIMDGLYRWADPPAGTSQDVSILFSGTANLAAREAQEELAQHYGVGAELWSATSYKKLREQALKVDRWNRLHPDETPRIPLVAKLMATTSGPIVAVTDFMTMVPDQVARWMPREFLVLGTDGYGRSDSRAALRHFFETDTGHVVMAALSGLVRQGRMRPSAVSDAMQRYGIDPEAPNPAYAHK